MTNIGNIWGHIPKSLQKDFYREQGFLEEEQYETLADYVTRPEHLIVQMHTLLSRSMAITSGQRQALEYLLMFIDSKTQGKNRSAKKPDSLCYFMSIFYSGFDGIPLELIACMQEKSKEDGFQILMRLTEKIKVRNINIALSDKYSTVVGLYQMQQASTDPRSPMFGWTGHPQGNGLFNPPGYMSGQRHLPPLRNTMMGRGAPGGYQGNPRGRPQGN